MKKEQLIQIANVGFPDRVKQFIDFDNCTMHHWCVMWALFFS